MSLNFLVKIYNIKVKEMNKKNKEKTNDCSKVLALGKHDEKSHTKNRYVRLGNRVVLLALCQCYLSMWNTWAYIFILAKSSRRLV